MKKLLSIGLLCFLVGCFESPVDESGKHIAERKGTNEFNVVLYPGGERLTFHYIMIDGHECIVMTGPKMGGLTHSPKCQCLNRNAEIVLPVNIVTNCVPNIVPL